MKTIMNRGDTRITTMIDGLASQLKGNYWLLWWQAREVGEYGLEKEN